MDARIAAVRVLQRVLVDGRSLSEALDAVRPQVKEADQGLLRELVNGVLRWYPRLSALAARLLSRPLKNKDQDVQLLILVGIYQCLETRIPPHAAVATTVEGARQLRKAWASGMVNAVLRRLLRERDSLLDAVESEPEARYSHPAWMIEHYRKSWPESWESMLRANNERAPMTLRVNRRRIALADYLARLNEVGLRAQALDWSPDALVLEAPVGVERLPGFAEGLVSVQDLAAQQAAPLLDVPDGARVLDACAAPGGKSCHLLERYPAIGELVAVDVDEQRLGRIHQNLRRLGLQATVLAGDAANPADWWDGKPFDRILLDAPCSGTGVIRRHPDIKWLRRREDIAALSAAQRRLLEGLWPLLRPGGKLLYATCSVFPEENERQLADFLRTRPDAQAQHIDAAWGVAQTIGRQVLTGSAGMDGFYYGCLIKK